MLLFRDFNILSAPNNSTDVTTVTAQRGPERGDGRRRRGQKHQHHQQHDRKSTKRRCG